jgi:hypothetical protein
MTHATTLHRAVMAVTATTLIGASGVAGQVGNNMGVLNPNLAGEDEIRALPHMTAELAGTVVAERPQSQHGQPRGDSTRARRRTEDGARVR